VYEELLVKVSGALAIPGHGTEGLFEIAIESLNAYDRDGPTLKRKKQRDPQQRGDQTSPSKAVSMNENYNPAEGGRLF
jgi:hypothetical protein